MKLDCSAVGTLRWNLWGVCAAFVAILLVCPFAFTQGNAGRILGTITDQTGGVIPGAMVTVIDTQRNVSRALTTDAAGEYNAPNLLPSTYTVRAAAKGFKTIDRAGVLLEVGGELRVDLTLQPGEQTQTITVNEAAPLLETTNAELGGTIQSNIIENLPLNGRNFENLLQLRPGVMSYPGGTSYSQSTNGLRAHENLFLVNGVYSETPWDGQSVMNSVLHAGDAGTILPVDAIDEFRTEENPRAEYGWKPGAIVNVGVKSGTNNIHGTAYAYGRDTAFDARNWYDQAPEPKAQVGMEQFGGTLGGAIKKDKLFYFMNYEGQNYSIGNPAQHNFPVTTSIGDPSTSLIDACLAAATAGTLTALSSELAGLNYNKATLGSATPTGNCTPRPGQPSDGFLGLFPVNNGPGTSVFTSIPNTNTINGGLGKIDYHISDHHALEGMYFLSQGNSVVAGDPTLDVNSNWLNAQFARAQAALGTWTWTPNSTWVNEVLVGYSRYHQDFETNDHTLNPADYPFNGATYVMPTGITNPVFFGMPAITINGLSNRNGIGQGLGPHITGPEGVLSIQDNVSYLRGKHAFKFGGEILYNRATEFITSNAHGPVTFSPGGPGGLVNFFNGDVFRAALMTGNPGRTISNEGYAGFLQDDWRVTPRLTLNLGVRYEVSTVQQAANNEIGNFDPVLGLVQVGNQIGTPYHGDYNNLSPRVGLAWDVFGDGKTVVRAAGSIIYESALTFDVTEAIGNLLGLRTIPTGLPLYNNGGAAPLPLAGNINLESTTYTGAAVAPISANWQAFNPALPISGTNLPLYNNLTAPGCGDGVTRVAGAPGGTSPAPCSLVAVDPNLHIPYVENWNLGIERSLNNNLSLDVEYVGNHAVGLAGFTDINQAQSVGGFNPGWGNPADPTSAAGMCIASATDATPYDNCNVNTAAEQAALPFTAPCKNAALFANIGAGAPGGSGGVFNPHNSCFSYLADISMVNNGFMSDYNGLQVTLTGRNYHGLSFVAGYTYSHALGDASDEGRGSDLSVPINNYASVRQQLYMATNYDLRHRATFSVTYNIPGRKGYAQMLQGWSVDGIFLVQSGSPWGQSDLTDDFSGTGEINNAAGSMGEQWNFYGNPKDFTPIHGWTDTNCTPGGGCSGGLPFYTSGDTTGGFQKCVNANNAHFLGTQLSLAMASLFNIGCYAVGNSVLLPPAFGSYGTSSRNLWYDAGFHELDMSVTKLVKITERFNAQFRVDFFNVLNTPIFCNPNGIAGGANSTPGDPSSQPFGAAGSTPDVCASNPEIGSGAPRSMQLGLKLTF